MLVLGHVGTAAAVAHAADRKVDLRWVIFFTLLADLVDKPLGLVILRETVNNGRIYFHSLLVNVLLTLVLVLARKPLVYSLSLWLHQLGDRMWMRPWTALWPFAGRFGYRELLLQDWVYGVFSRYNVAGEVLGLALLLMLGFRHGLFSRKRARDFLRTGRLRPPTSVEVEEVERV